MLGASQSMIPLSKNDLKSIENLDSVSDEEILEHLPQLLEWLKDCNWPVFQPICRRISKLKTGFNTEIQNVLNGSDTIWKCNIVGHLFPSMELQKVESFESPLLNLLNKATMQDYEEGLIDYVEIQLSRIAKST